MTEMTTGQLAAICGGQLEGDPEVVIRGANTIEQAEASEISFADSDKAVAAAASSSAGCLVVPQAAQVLGNHSLIRSANPRLAFVQILHALYAEEKRTPSIHPTAIVSPSARIGAACEIAAYTTVGENAEIGSHCSIGAGCRIGDGVKLGDNTVLHPNVTLYRRVRIGNRCILHAGCVIGADGFGYTFVSGHFEKFPQVGSVEIGDDVELGANCCVDRAALGVTRIGDGTKLDNLVHVAHNCVLGSHVVVAAQTGFSGSVTVGDYAMIGGQAGIGEKANIDSRAVVGGKAGILTSQHVVAGEPVWGIPARPLKQHLRGLAHVARLPKTEQDVKDVKKRLSELERVLHERSQQNL